MDFGGNVLRTFSPELKGKLYEVAAPLFAENSHVLGFAGNTPVDLTKDSVIASVGSSAAHVVGESGAKPEGTSNFTTQPINSAKLVIQQRYSDEVLDYDAQARMGLLETTIYENISSLARGIDILVLHGTNPATGSSISGNAGINVQSWLTQNAAASPATSDDPEEVQRALKEAIVAVNSGRFGRVNGGILAPEAYFDLAGAYDQAGNLIAPGFDFAGTAANYRGISVTQSNVVAYDHDVAAVGASGSETNILALVGDFSRIKVGVEFVAGKMYTQGDPDNTGRDLAGHNEVLWRNEVKVQSYIERPEAFGQVVAANGDDNGDGGEEG